MERIVKVCLRCFVVVLCVIVSRLDHHVTYFPVIKLKELSEREPELLASQEVHCRVIFAVDRLIQFFGLDDVFAPALQSSMTSPVTARSSSWSISMSQNR